MREFNILNLKRVVKDGCEIYVPADQLTALLCEVNCIVIPEPREVMKLKEQGFDVLIKQS